MFKCAKDDEFFRDQSDDKAVKWSLIRFVVQIKICFRAFFYKILILIVHHTQNKAKFLIIFLN